MDSCRLGAVTAVCVSQAATPGNLFQDPPQLSHGYLAMSLEEKPTKDCKSPGVCSLQSVTLSAQPTLGLYQPLAGF